MRLALRHLVRALSREPCGLLTDHQLLERYRASRDEHAFAALLARHGPLVLGVCRRALRHEQDAEDVFQATFLVLARKAGTIRRGASLGSWLHGVAARLAWRARRAADRRRRYERAVPPPSAPEPDGHEAAQVLDEELRRLPESLREPLLLCYLAGRTQQQAANQLGWSFGTLRRRLEQARERLRRQLLRRGLGPASLLAAAPVAAPAVRPALTGATVRTVLHGAASSRILTLAEKGLRSMFLTKTKLGLALAVALAVGGLVAHRNLTAQQSPRPEGQNPANAISDYYRLRLKPAGVEGSPGTSADLDRHLADVETRLEAALREVRAARQALRAGKGSAEVFRLKHAQATQVAEVLRAALPDARSHITADESTNSVIVQVGEAEAATARKLIEALDAGKAPAAPLKPGKASTH